MPLNVIVIGGGIGGLCLAHGLRKAGVCVTVYEKGPRRVDPQWLHGYQIHINPHGARALQDCLPTPLWTKLLNNACVPATAFQALTEQMNPIAVVEAELMNGSSHVTVVRTTLRRVLLEGLDDAVQFGKEFVGYKRTANGQVTAVFSDGTAVTADVLVGADGTGSNVRKQYLVHAGIVDSGIVGVACRVPITTEARSRLPGDLLTRLTSIVPATSGYMIVTQSMYKPTEDVTADDIPDHLIWVFVSRRTVYGDADPKSIEGRAIKTLLLGLMDNWHPVLRRLVADSDPTEVAAVPVLTSIPISRWEPTNVTLLGDAIHTMTPLLGLGGSTALRDAGLLCRELTNVGRGRSTVVDAVREYERAMIDYGFRAVRRSARFGKAVVADSPLLRVGFRAALRFVAGIPALKRRIFRATNWS